MYMMQSPGRQGSTSHSQPSLEEAQLRGLVPNSIQAFISLPGINVSLCSESDCVHCIFYLMPTLWLQDLGDSANSASAHSIVHKYRVKVINPKNKKNYKWLNLHDVNRRFYSVLELKRQLMESLGEHVPAETDMNTFNVGYLKKPSQAKHWLITERDLEIMYGQSGEEISLWCDHRLEEDAVPPTSTSQGNKRPGPSASTGSEVPTAKRVKNSTNYSKREDEIEELSTELRKIHGEKYTYPQYKLWARMIKCGQHAHRDHPPNVPMITGSYSKEKKQKDSGLGDLIAGATVAIVKLLKAHQRERKIVLQLTQWAYPQARKWPVLKTT